jgi:hypothetical protein
MHGILAIVAAAEAFAPTADTWIGVEPNRTWRADARRQLQLTHQPAWAEFVGGEGRGWRARFDQRVGTPHRMWGPGIAVGRLASEADAERAVRRFLSRNPDLAGVPARDLVLRSASQDAATDTWYVNFDRLVGGAPVWRGGVTARIRGERLVMLGIDTYPGAEVGRAELSAEEAEREAQLQGPAAMAEHRDVSARLVALPTDVPGGVELRLVWEVRSRTDEPLGAWVSFVDAGTGELVTTYNEIRFLTGTVSGTHPLRTLDGQEETTRLPLVEVTGEGVSWADEDGVYEVEGTTATTMLRGSYLTVTNASGAEGVLTLDPPDGVWDTPTASLAEIASYAFVHQVKSWSWNVAPEIRMSSVAIRSSVNSTRYSCNAYYDGNLNFFAAADGCNNTGQIADVNYHEWGHGFHLYAASLGGGQVDGSVGEGVGDAVAFLLTADSTIAPYFMTDGSGIRDVARNRVYPDDVVGEVHTDGLIFGGAVWDVWDELLTTYGEERADRGEAWAVTSRLLAHALKGGPALDTSYEEFVLADDDDGDLSNGTPHLCEIASGFAKHGLGPLADGAGAILVDHTALTNQAPGVDLAVEGTVANLLEQCQPFSLASAEVRYSVDGGENWETAAGTVNGSSFRATLPPMTDGTIVSYYVSATGSDGEAAFAPTQGRIAPYTFYVGELTEVWCSTLTDDAGFTHELISGEAREGADDWAHGAPEGQAGDPESGFTGRRVWGNDLGGDGYNGEYQARIHNRLTSPPIPTTSEELIVQYRRWLGVEDGYYDQARVLDGTGVIWANHATNEQIGDENTADDEWMLATHRAHSLDGALTIAFEIESDEGFESGGWNIDDICVYAPVPPLDTPDTGDEGPDDEGGKVDTIDASTECGCASGNPAGSGVVALAAALWLSTRRRR